MQPVAHFHRKIDPYSVPAAEDGQMKLNTNKMNAINQKLLKRPVCKSSF